MAKKKVTSKRTSPKKSRRKKRYWPVVIFIFLPLIAFSIWYLIQKNQHPHDKKAFIETIPKGFESFGIDLSHHQGKIDWNHLFKTEHYDTIIDFVYCKATEGSTHIDTRWESNRQILNEFGVANGAYHFLNTKKPPRPQVSHFLHHWQKRSSDLPPVLDVEREGYSDEDLRAKMMIWLDEVEKQTGMRPIIYTSLHFFQTKFRNYFPKHKFWIAAYSQQPTCLTDDRVIHWQYSEEGVLPGIAEEVDFNVSKIGF